MAQQDEIDAHSIHPSEESQWFSRLHELSAAHYLSREFKKDVNDPKLAQTYKRAYEFHMAEAARYKDMLNDIAKSITIDLDKPNESYDTDMAEHMKKKLQKKKE